MTLVNLARNTIVVCDFNTPLTIGWPIDCYLFYFHSEYTHCIPMIFSIHLKSFGGQTSACINTAKINCKEKRKKIKL
jgi:hypothetical protein